MNIYYFNNFSNETNINNNKNDINKKYLSKIVLGIFIIIIIIEWIFLNLKCTKQSLEKFNNYIIIGKPFNYLIFYNTSVEKNVDTKLDTSQQDIVDLEELDKH